MIGIVSTASIARWIEHLTSFVLTHQPPFSARVQEDVMLVRQEADVDALNRVISAVRANDVEYRRRRRRAMWAAKRLDCVPNIVLVRGDEVVRLLANVQTGVPVTTTPVERRRSDWPWDLPADQPEPVEDI